MLGAQLVEIPKTKFAKNPKDLMIMLGQMILETLAFLDTHQRCNHMLKQKHLHQILTKTTRHGSIHAIVVDPSFLRKQD